MQLNEELLKKVGVTDITYENNPNDLRCLGYYDGRTCMINNPTIKLSLELDKRKLEDFQKAIEKLDEKTDEMELKNELLTMHNVNACPGSNVSEKIDKYLGANVWEPNIGGKNIIQRYKIKHR